VTAPSVVPMTESRFTFTAEVWLHEGPAGWHFVSLPEPVTDEIDDHHGHRARGFGSLRVEVRIGTSHWQTSIFPDTARGTYLLPIKKAVRTAEKLDHGVSADVELTVLD